VSQSAHSGNDPVIAGMVLPLQRAEELIATLPSVVSVRVVPTDSGGVDTIHVLMTGETQPKQMVRNVESALMAHLGLRVDHRKVSVATTTARPNPVGGMQESPVKQPELAVTLSPPAKAPSAPVAPATPVTPPVTPVTPVSGNAGVAAAVGTVRAEDAAGAAALRRTMYFEDVEIRGSRAKGVACTVTLRRGDETFVGEAEGVESDRSRMELAARATLIAMGKCEGNERRVLSLEGSKVVEAFDREFVFVGVSVRLGRASALMTGSAEVKDSLETAAVLAVLDATNRWVAGRAG
jgi:hypothetical protein